MARRTCKLCQKTWNTKKKVRSDNVHDSCEACRAKEWRSENYERSRDSVRNAALKGKFGIGLSDYITILDSQGGCCGICKCPPPSSLRSMCVDHDHKSGVIRGVLCFRCNYGLSWYNDSPERLSAAASYVSDPPAVRAIGQRTVPPKHKRKKSYRLDQQPLLKRKKN